MLVFLGGPKPVPSEEGSRSTTNVVWLWERCSEIPKRINCCGCPRYPLGGSTQVSGDVWFTQWTNSIAVPFPLLQTAPTAPKPASHPLSYSSQRQFRVWLTVTMFHFLSFIFFTAMCIFDLDQSQGATKEKEYLLGTCLPALISLYAWGREKRGSSPCYFFVATMKHTEVLCRYHR